jgi:hypothetical protein
MHVSGLLNGGKVWMSVSKVYAAYVNYIMCKGGATLEIASCRGRKICKKSGRQPELPPYARAL